MNLKRQALLLVVQSFQKKERDSIYGNDTEMTRHQKFKFGGLIGYGNSCLDSVYPYSKVFRLHAILHDAAGAVRAHSGKGPGYCYMIGRGPNSCLLGHVTGLLFCLYVNIFLLSIFNSVDF